MTSYSREIPVVPKQTALLFIDVQNYTAHREGGEFKSPGGPDEAERAYYLGRMETMALPNMQRIQKACRQAGIEVLYTLIENQTEDGRDRSLDYKISGIDVAKGSWDAKVPDVLAPGADEMVIPKTSSSVFISTNIDYVLRNLEIKQLILCGVVTDQCVESAVRDACDLGYLVTLVPDACATFTQERQQASVRAIAGYCRQRSTEELLAELSAS
ncbi:isochorismatase family cysteine hydrolase [Aurantimonas sp. VKM B-3413]|uniref:isochorismatase family cysteine hydrolase n=1 Tax=Aurantimonas sp. VKM B-3413 TaxID=2779401 RepID=UPI001E3D4BB2|nr:isochorismatase family cysteine hydrolase [Aurantimonas sp. VKM B-3413]MCB8839459.1 cysteine hydrolase [Aurantimonas sp. VKM B-3413]